PSFRNGEPAGRSVVLKTYLLPQSPSEFWYVSCRVQPVTSISSPETLRTRTNSWFRLALVSVPTALWPYSHTRTLLTLLGSADAPEVSVPAASPATREVIATGAIHFFMSVCPSVDDMSIRKGSAIRALHPTSRTRCGTGTTRRTRSTR